MSQSVPPRLAPHPSSLHHRSILRALDQLIAGEKQIRLLGALSPINPKHMCLKLDFICGGRGPFPGATAMVVVLVVSLAGLESILPPPYVVGLNI